RSMLTTAGIRADRSAQATGAILRDRFGSTPVAPCWLLRLPPDAPFWQHLRQALLTRQLRIFLVAYVAQMCVSVTAWWIVGRAALEGRFDRGTMVAWVF